MDELKPLDDLEEAEVQTARMELAEEATSIIGERKPSKVFSDNLKANATDEPHIDLWPYTAALRDTIGALIADAAEPDQKSKVQAALGEFVAAVMTYLSKPPILEALRESLQRPEGVVMAEASSDANFEMAEVDGSSVPVVTLIRAGLNKAGTREYTPEFLQAAIAEGRFTNSFSYLNHPTPEEKRSRPERDMRYLAAHTGDAFWSEQDQSVKAPLVFIAEDHPQSMGSLAKQQFANPVVRQRAGLSIYYTGDVQFKEVLRTVKGGQQRKVAVPVRLGDDRKFDVDLVTAPGAGGGFSLLEANRDSQEEEAMDLSTLTLDQLREARPDLLAEAAEDSAPKPPEQEAPAAPIVEGVSHPNGDDIRELVEAAVAKAVAPLQEKLASHDKSAWFDAKLAECHLSEQHAEHIRRSFDGKVFATPEAFSEAFDDELEHLRGLLESPRDRIASLGPGAGATGDEPATLGQIVGFMGGVASNG